MDKLYFGQCWTSNSLQISDSRWWSEFCSLKSSTALFKYIPYIFLPSDWAREESCSLFESAYKFLNYHYKSRKAPEGWEGSQKFAKVSPELSGYFRDSSKRSSYKLHVVWQVENLAGGVCVYHSKYLIIINKSLKLMVSLNHLQGCSFKHILYNTWSPECMCVELQIDVVTSVVQLTLFLIQIIACTTGTMPHERNSCNCHNKNNLTDCFFL